MGNKMEEFATSLRALVSALLVFFTLPSAKSELFGLNAMNQIMWKDFAAPNRPENTVVRILDWVEEL